MSASVQNSVVRNSKIQNINKIVNASSQSSSSSNQQLQQLSTISLMLEYDIDNTLNTIKENGVHLLSKQQESKSKYLTPTSSIDSAQSVEVMNVDMTTATTAAETETETETTAITAITATTKDGNGNINILPPTPPATPNLQNTARKRWRILAKVLKRDSEETVSSGEEFTEEQTASVRRFKSFDLLRQDSFEDHMTLNCLGKPENWYKYRVVLDTNGQEYSVNIHHAERQLTASDLMGFNNTGNICVWPSEEALTAYVLTDLETYRNKWILELGGGFTCLSGLMLSKYAKPYAVHLTDGNAISVENVKKTICLNELSCYTKCSVLQWEDIGARTPDEAEKFDVILSADCLFFDEARKALVDTIWFYLSRDGIALIMAPRRGKTMANFIEEASSKGFRLEIKQRYNETIWQRHLELKNSALYDEDLHYPVLLLLRKPAAMMDHSSNACYQS